MAPEPPQLSYYTRTDDFHEQLLRSCASPGLPLGLGLDAGLGLVWASACGLALGLVFGPGLGLNLGAGLVLGWVWA